ncbi:MAG TPA: DUF1385 domain-containing protein [Cyanobacteria bacterium UBA8530]|nr:DUF1385 domain-containing protein [Cyanobacteria bacterium UBA8530]
MMRGLRQVAVAVRSPEGEIVLHKEVLTPWRKRHPILALPLIRGSVTLVESMAIGFRMLNVSANIATGEKPEKGESWFAIAIGLLLFVLLFKVLPATAFKFLQPFVPNILFLNAIEGGIRMSIFLLYLGGISLLPDVRRLFEYHGAEHQVIHCYESGKELTPENAKAFPSAHPRCGTSFLLVTLVLSILIFALLGSTPTILDRVVRQLLLLPVVAGFSYELIRLAGKGGREKNLIGRIALFLTIPGIWLQGLTTRKAQDDQLEVAIASLHGALEDPADLIVP